MIGFKSIRVTLNPSDQAVVDEIINEKNKKTSQIENVWVTCIKLYWEFE